MRGLLLLREAGGARELGESQCDPAGFYTSRPGPLSRVLSGRTVCEPCVRKQTTSRPVPCQQPSASARITSKRHPLLMLYGTVVRDWLSGARASDIQRMWGHPAGRPLSARRANPQERDSSTQRGEAYDAAMDGDEWRSRRGSGYLRRVYPTFEASGAPAAVHVRCRCAR